LLTAKATGHQTGCLREQTGEDEEYRDEVLAVTITPELSEKKGMK
jgi:hypothetical protein